MAEARIWLLVRISGPSLGHQQETTPSSSGIFYIFLGRRLISSIRLSATTAVACHLSTMLCAGNSPKRSSMRATGDVPMRPGARSRGCARLYASAVVECTRHCVRSNQTGSITKTWPVRGTRNQERVPAGGVDQYSSEIVVLPPIMALIARELIVICHTDCEGLWTRVTGVRSGRRQEDDSPSSPPCLRLPKVGRQRFCELYRLPLAQTNPRKLPRPGM
ncbi:uncharacterized protein LY79DRAFT_248270 [Colletotrichum navitas]|uniref:Uncharacterized protein n=1 Tax=Colletotrichum navitas TaxID=681940 RepID=A0AAD8QBC3_9PEZI|nr:uncharacterized protein LY79DRAFT_248270 [Colletotrichum navitas]KAK1598572.1 hypothetical protein LY79DRAFT_248270 [Colletotrichum navitas]